MKQAVAALCLVVSVAGAEIIDRMAVSVGNRVITESELKREIRLTAFLNAETPDFSPEAKHKAAERLIEQKLVRKELEFTRYPTPDASEAEPLVNEIKKKRSQNQAEFERELQKCGITEADLTAHLLWQLTLLRFLEIRFRPEIQISEEEIRGYFETHMQSADRGASLEEYRDKIEQTLRGQRVDKYMDAWLKEARTRTPIKYQKEVFK